MKTLDICFDLETCGCTANAAVMSIAAIPWTLSPSAPSPFLDIKENGFFFEAVDLRYCVIDGFEFEERTLKWWANQSAEAKAALVYMAPKPIDVVFQNFVNWILDLAERLEVTLDNISLWSQGTDFDVSIFRNICHKYDIDNPLKYNKTNDCRTFINIATDLAIKNGFSIRNNESISEERKKIYLKSVADQYYKSAEKEEVCLHSPISDCRQSIINVWSLYKRITFLLKK